MQKKEEKTVRLFGIASFLNDLGAYIIFPLWPFFLTNFLGANMTILGLIDGLGDALVSISQAISGYASDRLRKRKVFIWLGYLLGGLARVGYSITTFWPTIIPFRILDRAGKIRDAPRDAIVADASNQKNRGKNFGYLRGMDKAGAVFGIILSILLFNALGYQTLFALAAIPSIIGAGMIYLWVKEKKDGKIKLFKGMKFSQLGKDYKTFLVLGAIFSIGSFSYSFLLILAKQLGFEITVVPLLFLIFTLFAAIFSIPFGKLADKIGRKKVLYISFALWGLTCFLFIITNNPLIIILAFILYGLHIASFEPVQKAYVSELSPKKFKASALGGYQLVVGICAFPSSFFAGILWDKISPSAPFIFAIGLTIISILMLRFVKETEKLKK